MHSFPDHFPVHIMSTDLSCSFAFPGFLRSTQNNGTQISYRENEREINSLQNLGNEDMPDRNTECEIEATRNLFQVSPGAAASDKCRHEPSIVSPLFQHSPLPFESMWRRTGRKWWQAGTVRGRGRRSFGSSILGIRMSIEREWHSTILLLPKY